MPKYNLIDDEELENSANSAPQEKSDLNEEPEKSTIADYILDDLSISDPDLNQAQSAPDDEYNIPPAPTTSEPPVEPAPPMEPDYLPDDYQDDKLPGPNFKPFIWIAAALVAVVLIYLAVDNFFLSDQPEEATEKIETPEERLAREQEAQKQNILASMNMEKQARMQYLANLIDIKPKDVKYSGLLLYTNSLSVEAFAKDRAGLARLNMQLKSSSSLAGYTLETAVNRPGTRGGVFTLYNYKSLRTDGSRNIPAGNISSLDATTWLNQTVQKFGLQVAKQRQISSNRDQFFNIARQEYILNGSEEACFNLVKSMAGTPGNYKIHKLAIVSADQRNILRSNYQITVILDFYL